MTIRRVESFLLRLVVQDETSLDPTQWRGRIQHITTGCEQSVEQLQDVVAFITVHLSGDIDIEVVPMSPYPESSSPPRNIS